MERMNDPRLQAFGRLLDIMDELRAKCPWDMKQDIHSLRNLTIEETYELVEAIDQSDYSGIKEEIGDLMLHMVFYAKLGAEQKAFDITDALSYICDKLVRRHPHIYGDLEVSGAEEVKQNWEKLKLKEGRKSVLEGVPSGLPAIIKALRLQEKTAKVGFEWEKTEDVLAKVDEEYGELKSAVEGGNGTEMEEEFGDLLFALVNYARFIDVDPEIALEKCNQKFIRRYTYMEEKARSMEQSLADMSLAEMDAIWNEAKKALGKTPDTGSR